MTKKKYNCKTNFYLLINYNLNNLTSSVVELNIYPIISFYTLYYTCMSTYLKQE